MEDGDGDVDMDNSDEGEDGAEGWMDVDGEDESSPHKKMKTNTGGVINKRGPKSNRQFAGLRDEGVRSLFFSCYFLKTR
jgi:nucleolar GTP-binding protein